MDQNKIQKIKRTNVSTARLKRNQEYNCDTDLRQIFGHDLSIYKITVCKTNSEKQKKITPKKSLPDHNRLSLFLALK